MKTRTKVTAIVLGVLVFSGTAVAATLGIGSNPQGSIAYTAAAAVSKLVSEKSSDQVRVVPQGGPVVTLPMVNGGDLEFSVANAMTAVLAKDGKAMFAGRKHENLRMVAALFPLRTGLIVQKDSDIEAVSDLKGRKVSSGFAKQKGLLLMSQAMLATAGLTEDDIDGVLAPSGKRGVEDFMAGKVDAVAFSVGSGLVAQADASVGGVRFLSLPLTPESEAAMREITPGAFIEPIQPAPGLAGVESKTNVWMTPYVLLASDRTSEDVVYRVLKLMAENPKALVDSAKVFSDFTPAAMKPELGIPYHEGALKYFEEAGIN